MKTQHSGRSSFSGKLGFVLSAAGASVGLGNIWRFPYLAAKYGGGIFLLIYILLAVTFGYTMIMAETALGRMTRKSPVGAFAASGAIIRLFTNLYNVPCPISLSVTCRSENSPPVSCKPGHSAYRPWPYSTRPIPEVTVILKSPKSIWASVLIPES